MTYLVGPKDVLFYVTCYIIDPHGSIINIYDKDFGQYVKAIE